MEKKTTTLADTVAMLDALGLTDAAKASVEKSGRTYRQPTDALPTTISLDDMRKVVIAHGLPSELAEELLVMCPYTDVTLEDVHQTIHRVLDQIEQDPNYAALIHFLVQGRRAGIIEDPTLGVESAGKEA